MGRCLANAGQSLGTRIWRRANNTSHATFGPQQPGFGQRICEIERARAKPGQYRQQVAASAWTCSFLRGDSAHAKVVRNCGFRRAACTDARRTLPVRRRSGKLVLSAMTCRSQGVPETSPAAGNSERFSQRDLHPKSCPQEQRPPDHAPSPSNPLGKAGPSASRSNECGDHLFLFPVCERSSSDLLRVCSVVVPVHAPTFAMTCTVDGQ